MVVLWMPISRQPPSSPVTPHCPRRHTRPSSQCLHGGLQFERRVGSGNDVIMPAHGEQLGRQGDVTTNRPGS
ncbi:hypothetical protein E2C01_051419 [Portunus trituberculatus]|uniref:Uncharacterized protein n=1 Tax=Portunus trituberculatus TaxID=210409 RepID=A0A5B7GIV3_PORTR|nr:hypothetical protein [Portunus trituberculatus]